MIDWLFILQPLIWLGFFSTVFYLLGLGFNQRLFQTPTGTNNIFVNSVVGLSYSLLMCHVLLALGAFYLWSVLLFLMLPILVMRPSLPSWSLIKFGQMLLSHFGFWLVILLFFLPDTFKVYDPDSLHDAISYHLPYAKAFAENHELVTNIYLRYPLNTLSFDILFSLGFLFEGEILARMFNVYCTFLLLLGIYTFCVAHLNKLCALIACWGFCGIEMVSILMVSAYVDLGLSLFIFSSVYFIISYLKTNNINLLRLSALCFAVALGIKYLALMLLPIYLICLLLICRNKKHLWQLLLIVLLFGSPWYIRNIYISGNPFHPFAQPVFGFWLWTQLDLITQQADLLINHGVERTFDQFLKLPYLFYLGIFNKEGTFNLMLIAGMALLPFGLLFKGVVRIITGFCLINLLFWFYSSQIARYLIFVFPFLVILPAYFVSIVIIKVAQWPSQMSLIKNINNNKWLVPLAIFLLVVAGFKSLKYHGKLVHHNFIATNEQQWLDLLQKKPQYQLVQQANLHAKLGTFVLVEKAVQYYFTGSFKGDWYGPANITIFLQNINSEDDLVNKMLAHQVDTLLIAKQHKIFSDLAQLIQGNLLIKVAENDFGYVFSLK